RSAKESILEKGKMNLACPVQGSIYPRLRYDCAQRLGDIAADVNPIGGVVPLMENQQYHHLIRVILASKKGLPVNRPVHLFGAGHPLVFPLAVALGCDLFDSSAYIKYAKQQRLIFPWGTERIDDLYELPCCCPVCSSYSLSELRSCSSKQREQLIAEHNLYVSMSEMKKVRNAVMQGRLWELVEQRVSANPFLQDAMHVLHDIDHGKWLEHFEPVRKTRGLFYTGIHTIHQSFFYRLHQRLLHWFDHSFDKVVVLSENEKPFNRTYEEEVYCIMNQFPDACIVVDSSIGPVPIVLDEMYPFAQYVFPATLDMGTEKIRKKRWDEFIGNCEVIFWDSQNHSILSVEEKNSLQTVLDEKKVKSVGQMQFGPDIATPLFDGVVSMIKSKKTNKIRNVFANEEHIVSMRASDGLFTLKLDGGKRIHKHSLLPRFRVVIEDDAVPFVKDGKSVFSKFVATVDKRLRPMDECIVVSNKDEFLAVGQCILSPYEMECFQFGQAVKVREHVS
ncbi:MAG: tRNA-guanine transglycosylase, partial [Candidatus Thermoplasmatota archaeon]|nr:tRNA-guanine transglycosylase [Candidatus Thermoplasmatota archaeon]